MTDLIYNIAVVTHSYTCDKMAQNYTHILFDAVVELQTMYLLEVNEGVHGSTLQHLATSCVSKNFKVFKKSKEEVS